MQYPKVCSNPFQSGIALNRPAHAKLTQSCTVPAQERTHTHTCIQCFTIDDLECLYIAIQASVYGQKSKLEW